MGLRRYERAGPSRADFSVSRCKNFYMSWLRGFLFEWHARIAENLLRLGECARGALEGAEVEVEALLFE